MARKEEERRMELRNTVCYVFLDALSPKSICHTHDRKEIMSSEVALCLDLKGHGISFPRGSRLRKKNSKVIGI